jgi:KDO2-lipid IV(A) lauroyltransferase
MGQGAGVQPVYWLWDRALRIILWVLLRLPYRWRVPMFGWLSSRIVAPIAGYDRRVRENLAQIMPELSPEEVRRIERSVADNVGRTMIEMYSGAEFVARAARNPPTGPGLGAFEAAAAAGRPVIIVTGHFGNYNAARAALIARGHVIAGLYRPLENPWFNSHYVAAMESIGKPMFARGRRGMAEMVRFLRGGGILGLLIDQRMQQGAKLLFFGHQALTALSAAELALKYDALLLPVYAIRQDNGLDFDILVEAAIPPGTPEAMTQALNDSLEALVRAHPGQWLWIHRRWKA